MPSRSYGFELSYGPGQGRRIPVRMEMLCHCAVRVRARTSSSFHLPSDSSLLGESHAAQQPAGWYHTRFLASHKLFQELRKASGKKMYLFFFYRDGFGDRTWKEGETFEHSIALTGFFFFPVESCYQNDRRGSKALIVPRNYQDKSSASLKEKVFRAPKALSTRRKFYTDSTKPAAGINQFLQHHEKIFPSAPGRGGVWVPPLASEKSHG